jgi:hypothetical protein
MTSEIARASILRKIKGRKVAEKKKYIPFELKFP